MKTLPADAPFKVIGFLHRRADITGEQFRRHWRTTHLEEALKLKKYMSGYVQNHVLDESVPGFEPYCAGMPILWFDRAETSAAMGQSEEYMTGAYVDEPNFMRGRSEGMPCREIVLTPGQSISIGATSTKIIALARAKVAMDEKDFLDWADRDRETILRNEGEEPMRVIRSVSLVPGDRASSPFDVAEEYWWGAGAEPGRAQISAGAATALDTKTLSAMRIEEVRAVWGEEVSYAD